MFGLELRLPTPLEPLRSEWLRSHGVEVWLKREDLVHTEIPGNKWRKLKYNLLTAQESDSAKLLTFGGAYSNHVRAVAAAGALLNFETIGVIRGELHEPLNKVLAFAESRGMRLTYMDRASYRDKMNPNTLAELRGQFGNFYLIPEGGSNAQAVTGCAELVAEIDTDFDIICCPCGTGGTLAGISAGLNSHQRATGFAALKSADFLREDVRQLQMASIGRVVDNWSLDTSYHFGGYAKASPQLIGFIEEFRKTYGLKLDWVYVAKMMYGLFDLIETGRIASGTRVIAVVTGSGESAD